MGVDALLITVSRGSSPFRIFAAISNSSSVASEGMRTKNPCFLTGIGPSALSTQVILGGLKQSFFIAR